MTSDQRGSVELRADDAGWIIDYNGPPDALSGEGAKLITWITDYCLMPVPAPSEVPRTVRQRMVLLERIELSTSPLPMCLLICWTGFDTR